MENYSGPTDRQWVVTGNDEKRWDEIQSQYDGKHFDVCWQLRPDDKKATYLN